MAEIFHALGELGLRPLTSLPNVAHALPENHSRLRMLNLHCLSPLAHAIIASMSMNQQQTQRKSPPHTYSVPEAAERLGIGRSSAYQAARNGQIKTITIGRRLLVPKAWLDEQLYERERAS
jgi:excisionase family DNA binding protein